MSHKYTNDGDASFVKCTNANWKCSIRFCRKSVIKTSAIADPVTLMDVWQADLIYAYVLLEFPL